MLPLMLFLIYTDNLVYFWYLSLEEQIYRISISQ